MKLFSQWKKSIPLIMFSCLLLSGCASEETMDKDSKDGSIGLAKKLDNASFKELSDFYKVYLTDKGLESASYRSKYAKYISNTPNYIKQAALQYEKAQPTAHSPSVNQLSKCRFVSHRVEMDNKIDTAEWLVTTLGKGHCQAQSRYHPKTFWVVQQTGSKQPIVLLANRTYAALIQSYKKGEVLRSIAGYQKNMVDKTEINCYRYLHYNGRVYKQTGEKREAFMSDPMLPYKAWLETTNSAYKCLE